MTDEPSVLAWQIATAPRPRYAVGRHWWRQMVTECWRAAYDAWCAEREQATALYAAELAEWVADNPAPRLSDFMRHLSTGEWAPESVMPQP